MNIQKRIILVPILAILLVGGVSSTVMEAFVESLLKDRIETELNRIALLGG